MSKYQFFNTGTRSGCTVATQFPMFGEGRPIRFWADKGRVRYEDERPDMSLDERSGSMDWRQAAERVKSLSEMIIRSSEDRRWRSERIKMQQFITEMEDVIRTAKGQGGPFDGDAVLRDYKRRRPVSVVVPKEIDL